MNRTKWGVLAVMALVAGAVVASQPLVSVAQDQPRERPVRGERRAPTGGAEEPTRPAARQAPDEPIRLRFRFDAGQSRRFRLIDDSTEVTQDRGRSITQRRTTELEYTQAVQEVLPDGSAWLGLTYDRIRYRQSSTLNPTALSFDSASNEPPPDPALMPYAKLAGRTVRIQVSPDGSVHAVEGYTELLDDIFAELAGEPFDRLRELLLKQFSNEAMREAMARLFHVLPSQRVEPGDHWERTLSQVVAFVGELHANSRFTLRQVEVNEQGRSIATIGMGTEFHHAARAGDNQAADDDEFVPGIAARGELRRGALSGEIRFDVEAGRIVGSRLEQNLVLGWRATQTDGGSRPPMLDLTSTITGTITLEEIAPPAEPTGAPRGPRGGGGARGR